MGKAQSRGIFVSYSHQDASWLKMFSEMAAPLIRLEQIEVWSDQAIPDGSEWNKEIDQALDRASVAVLLVSPGFLDSSFITKVELPSLLSAAKQRRLILLPVVVGACLYNESELRGWQAVFDPSQPLEGFSPPVQRERIAEVCRRAKQALDAAGEVEGKDPRANGESVLERRILDMAVRSTLVVGRKYQFHFLIRHEDSKGLAAEVAEDRQGARKYDFGPGEVRSDWFDVEFPATAGSARPVDLEVRLVTPDFEPASAIRPVRLHPQSDSMRHALGIQPRTAGPLLIIMEIWYGSSSIGSAGLETTAVPSDGPPRTPAVDGRSGLLKRILLWLEAEQVRATWPGRD